MRPIVASDESLILLPLSFDMRALNGALLSLAALFYRRHVVGEVVVAAKLSQDEKGVVFAWEFRSNELFPSKEVLEQLTDVSPKQIRKVGGSDFFAEVMAVFVNLVIGCYDGTIAAKAEGEGGAIKLTVRPR
jgi:hypothetical protein